MLVKSVHTAWYDPGSSSIQRLPSQEPSNNGGTKSAGKLRDNCNIGDFRAWKDHDAYQRTVERLLRALPAKTKTA